MIIYIKNTSDGSLQRITLIDLLEKAFKKSGLKTDKDSHADGSGSWLHIIQENEKSLQITTAISFEDNGNDITDLGIYVAEIKRIIDEDNQEKLV